MSNIEKTERINANRITKKPKRSGFVKVVVPVLLVLMALVGVASAETVYIDPAIIDFANLSTLLGNMAQLFPGIISLVTQILPLIFIMAIIGLVVGVLDAIVGMVAGLMSFIKR